MSNYWEDPEAYGSGVREGVDRVTAPGVDRFGRRLGGAIGDTWQQFKRLISGSEGLGGGGLRGGDEPDLGTQIGRGLEEYRSKDAETTATGEGPIDRGRSEFGIEMPEAATPRVSPELRAEGAPMPEAQPEPAERSITADMDYIFGGGQNDAYSRMRSALADVAGTRAPREIAQVANRAYQDVTGENPGWREDDLYSVFTDPAAVEVILQGL